MMTNKLLSHLQIIPKHKKLIERLTYIYLSLGATNVNQFNVRIINDPSSLNAASFGNGRYLFWETLADLPQEAIDSYFGT